MHHTTPLISIIIPVYNVAPYLHDALDSILRQTYRLLEVIIIDDGSTDGSSLICDEFASEDDRFRVIHQQNGGLSNARNTGLDHMHGDFVAFMDPDDKCHPDFINILVESILRENADIAMCKYTIFEDNGKPIPPARQISHPEINQGLYDSPSALRALADWHINVNVWNKLFRRTLWNEIRFPDGHVYEDICTTYRIFDRCNSLYVVNKTLYMQRGRAGSITGTKSVSNTKDLIAARTQFINYVEKHTPGIFAQKQLLNVKTALLRTMIRYYFTSDKNDAEWAHYRKQLRKEILIAGNGIGIHHLDFRTKTAFFVIRWFPRR